MKISIPFFTAIALLFANVSPAQAPTPPAADGATKQCFECKGAGQAKCSVPSCKNGQANCPAPCLKPDDGTWVHMKQPGHPDTDLWKKFNKPGGGFAAWNQNHAGEIVKFANGDFVNAGKCTVCGGTTKIKCTVCKGTGQAPCSICDGKKVVPQSWTAFDNPKLKSRPSRFKLKDGTEIIGRKVSVAGSTATIKTEKDSIKVQVSDIVSEQKQPTQK